MNNTYVLQVGKSKKDGLFYGLIYRMDQKHGPMLAMSSKQGYKIAKEAAQFINDACDTMKMPEMRAKLMDVPADAYKTLKKFDMSIFSQKTNNLKISKSYNSERN